MPSRRRSGTDGHGECNDTTGIRNTERRCRYVPEKPVRGTCSGRDTICVNSGGTT